MGLHDEYIRILITARNEATKAMTEAGAEARGLQATFTDVGKGLMQGGAVVGALGVGLGVGVAALTKAGMDFQNQMTAVANNTTMTTAQVGMMQQTVLKLMATGASSDQLSQGFMHIMNAGFSAADAVNILTVANQSAIATGANTSDVANTLARTLHEFGLSAGEAGRGMNVIHLAAALGNSSLQQFNDNTSKASAMAANFQVPLIQVDSALSALSRHMDLSQANTALAGAFSKIINPAAGTEKLIKSLSRSSGVDLVHDFTSAGLASRGLTGVLADVAKATHGNMTEMLQLIPAMRGGLATIVLTGNGAKDYAAILKMLTETMAGKTDPTMAAFIKQQHTLTGELQDMRGALQATAVTIGLQLVPQVTNLLNNLNPAISGFNQWAQANSGVIAKLLPLGAAALAIAGGLTVAAGAVVILGTVMSPLGIAVLGLFTVTGLFIAAWIHNSGHIRQVVADLGKAFDDLSKGHIAIAFTDLDQAVNTSTGNLHHIMVDIQQIARLMNDVQHGNWQAAAGVIVANLPKLNPVNNQPMFPGVSMQQFNIPAAIAGIQRGTLPFTQPSWQPNSLPSSVTSPNSTIPLLPASAYGGTGANGPTSVTQHIQVHVAVSGDMTPGSATKVGDAIKEAFRTMRDTPKRANAYLPGAR